MTKPLGVIILAAGLSERMGVPKPLLRLGEKTFLERILANPFLSQSDITVVVVLGFEKEAIGANLPSFVHTVENKEFRQGRTGSLQYGLSVLPQEAEGAFLWPVDCPLVPERVLRELANAQRDDKTICIPAFQGRRGHPPLLGAYFFPEILQMGKDRSLRDLYRRHPEALRYVTVASEAVLHNVNTPEEFEVVKRYFDRNQ
ncbi:MAG: nucleotidyltransferase family protein [Candidatus Omnitrophota bacterium]